MICHINPFTHEVAVLLGYDALLLVIWFPTFQDKADILTSKSEMCLSPSIISPFLCATFCFLPSLIASLTLIVSQSPITPSLYIPAVTCSLVFLDISTHKDKTTTMCKNISDAA